MSQSISCTDYSCPRYINTFTLDQSVCLKGNKASTTCFKKIHFLAKILIFLLKPCLYDHSPPFLVKPLFACLRSCGGFTPMANWTSPQSSYFPPPQRWGENIRGKKKSQTEIGKVQLKERRKQNKQRLHRSKEKNFWPKFPLNDTKNKYSLRSWVSFAHILFNLLVFFDSWLVYIDIYTHTHIYTDRNW